MELVVVLAVVMVIAAVAAPMFIQSTLRLRQLDGAADRISSDLRRAQSLAVNNGGMARFNYAAGTYRLETSLDSGATWAVVNPSNSWYSIANDFGGVALSSVKDGNGTDLAEVRFDSRGSARGTPAVAQFPVVLLLTRGTDARSVLVQRTGNVSTQ
jgi:Tfp pilus assembly protein FimT